MGAEAVHDLLQRIDLDQYQFDLRNAAANELRNSVKRMPLSACCRRSFRDANSRITNPSDGWSCNIYRLSTGITSVSSLDGGRCCFHQI